MNSTSLTAVIDGCPDATLLEVLRHTSTAVYVFLAVLTIVNLLSFPFTILFNALVIIVVAIQRRLRSTTDVGPACLALTDVMVGLTVQPLRITTNIFILGGKTRSEFCIVSEIQRKRFGTFWIASLFHLVLISGERYLTIKNAFTYTSIVTKTRLLAVSAVIWIVAILPAISEVLNVIFGISIAVSVPVIVFCQTFVYYQARRHEQHLQVSIKAKKRFRKEMKALKTTTKIIAAVLTCYLPAFLINVILAKLLSNPIPPSSEFVVTSVWTTLLILNSLFNPLIYSVKNSQFRVAVIQLLLRKNLLQAKEIENRLFGSANVAAIIEEGQQRVGVAEGGENCKQAPQNASVGGFVALKGDLDPEGTISPMKEVKHKEQSRQEGNFDRVGTKVTAFDNLRNVSEDDQESVYKETAL